MTAASFLARPLFLKQTRPCIPRTSLLSLLPPLLSRWLRRARSALTCPRTARKKNATTSWPGSCRTRLVALQCVRVASAVPASVAFAVARSQSAVDASVAGPAQPDSEPIGDTGDTGESNIRVAGLRVGVSGAWLLPNARHPRWRACAWYYRRMPKTQHTCQPLHSTLHSTLCLRKLRYTGHGQRGRG